MELEILEVKDKTKTPIQTINKKDKPKVYFTIDRLTSSLPLTTDQIFKIFKNNNSDILKNLTINEKNIIENDASCRCFSMRKKKNNYSRKCKGCQVISRLIKTNYLTSDEIELFSGRNKNMFLQIYTGPLMKEVLYEKKEIVDRMLFYFYSNLKTLESYNITVNYYCTENKEYNYIINSIIMNCILREEKLSLYNNFIWGFVCNSTITVIKKLSIFRNIDQLCSSPYYSNYSSPILSSQERKLSKNTVYMIIKQLVFLLKTLSKHHFIHGEPCLDYISYTSEKITILQETFPLKLVLEPSCYTTQNYNNKRYFHNLDNKYLNFGVPFEKIDVHINGSKNYFIHYNILSEYDEMSILYYKIGNKSKIFSKTRNEYGIPICYKSFDFVCFMVSFVKDKYFYATFKESEKLMNIWKLLWKTDEYDRIMEEIENLEENNYYHIFNLLRKYHIRFDAMGYFYNELFKNIDSGVYQGQNV